MYEVVGLPESKEPTDISPSCCYPDRFSLSLCGEILVLEASRINPVKGLLTALEEQVSKLGALIRCHWPYVHDILSQERVTPSAK